MSTESSRQPDTKTWCASVIVVFLLYVGSFGPILAFFDAHRHGHPFPPMIETLYTPVMWLERNTVLKKPLDAYWGWWLDVFPMHWRNEELKWW